MTVETLARIPLNPTRWRNGLLLGLLSFVATLYCLELIKISGDISPLWFTTALMTIVVFRNPNRDLPLLLTACMCGVVSANAIILGPGLSNLKFPLINLAQALMGGVLLRMLLDREAPLDTLYSWLKMVLAVGLFTPLTGAMLASALLNIPASSMTTFFSTWVASEVIGMLALGPVGLLWQRGLLQRRRIVVELLLTLAVTLALSWLVLRYMPGSFTFVVVILFYSAVRLPRLAAFIVYLTTVSMISLMLALKLIPDNANSSPLLLTLPWLPFLLTLVPSHLMTLVMHSFREERKRISESETRFRHAMEYSAIGMALVSPEGQWLKVNQALCRLLGYRPEDFSTLTFQQISHPDDLGADLRQMSELLAGKIDTYSMEKRYLRSDGAVVWTLLAVSLVRDSEQQPLYFISQIEDITELKQTEHVNRQLMERITLANEAAGIGVWEWNLNTGVMSWDRRMFQLYGLAENTPANYITWINTLLPAERDRVGKIIETAVKTASPLDVEFRIDTGSGVRHIRCQGNVEQSDTPSRMLGINQDVTAIRQLTDALDQERERMHITLDAINEAVISTDEEMRVIFMNPVAEKMTGWPQAHAAGKPIADILRITHGGEGPEKEVVLSCSLPKSAEPDAVDEDLVLHNRAGEQFAIHFSLSLLSTAEGENIGSVMVIQDVSESRAIFKRLRYSASHDMLTRLPNRASFEQRLRLLLSPLASAPPSAPASPSGGEQHLAFTSPPASEQHPVSTPPDASEQQRPALTPPAGNGQHPTSTSPTGNGLHPTSTSPTGNGQHPASTSPTGNGQHPASTSPTGNGQHPALTPPTGNGQHPASTSPAANSPRHVLAFIDLDRFKAVNDSAGHAAGDALLRELSAIMQRQLRGNDFLARLGGDEFGVLLPDCSLEDAREIAHRLVNAIGQYRFLWQGQAYSVGASAGLAAFTHHDNAVEVMAQADIACYHAKNSGRGQVAIYGPASGHPFSH